jgi:hypothetical protein
MKAMSVSNPKRKIRLAIEWGVILLGAIALWAYYRSGGQ